MATATTTAEKERRRTFHRFIETGELSGGWATDDGPALIFFGTELNKVVGSRADAAA